MPSKAEGGISPRELREFAHTFCTETARRVGRTAPPSARLAVDDSASRVKTSRCASRAANRVGTAEKQPFYPPYRVAINEMPDRGEIVDGRLCVFEPNRQLTAAEWHHGAEIPKRKQRSWLCARDRRHAKKCDGEGYENPVHGAIASSLGYLGIAAARGFLRSSRRIFRHKRRIGIREITCRFLLLERRACVQGSSIRTHQRRVRIGEIVTLLLLRGGRTSIRMIRCDERSVGDSEISSRLLLRHCSVGTRRTDKADCKKQEPG